MKLKYRHAWNIARRLFISRRRRAEVESELLELESRFGEPESHIADLYWRFHNLMMSIRAKTDKVRWDVAISNAQQVAAKELSEASLEVRRQDAKLAEILKKAPGRWPPPHLAWNGLALSVLQQEHIQTFHKWIGDLREKVVQEPPS